MSQEVVVRHNPAAGRYEASIGGSLAVADYRVEGDRIIFTHTFVPPELRGQGVAEKLVQAALEDARRDGRRVVPQCSYVALFIRRHREFQTLVTPAAPGSGAGGSCK